MCHRVSIPGKTPRDLSSGGVGLHQLAWNTNAGNTQSLPSAARLLLYWLPVPLSGFLTSQHALSTTSSFVPELQWEHLFLTWNLLSCSSHRPQRSTCVGEEGRGLMGNVVWFPLSISWVPPRQFWGESQHTVLILSGLGYRRHLGQTFSPGRKISGSSRIMKKHILLMVLKQKERNKMLPFLSILYHGLLSF